MWTYSGNPGSCDKDAVRFLISDTNTNKQLVQDEEIEYMIANEMNVYMAAAQICNTLVAKAGGVTRKRISEFDISYDPKFYHSLAATLSARGSSHQLPYAGGISIADKMAQQQDIDAVSPAVAKNLDNNPAAPQPEIPSPNSSNPLTTI